MPNSAEEALMPAGKERIAKGQLLGLTPNVDFWSIMPKNAGNAEVLSQ